MQPKPLISARAHAGHAHAGHNHLHREHAPTAAVPAGHAHGHGHESDANSAPSKARSGAEVEYTCPMHPQVRQMGPGNCPICGMGLEPVLATALTGDSPELQDMTRRFWIGLALTAPVFALEMGGHLVDLHHLIPQQTSNWIQLLFGTPVVLWAGWPFFVRAWASLKNRSLNMFTLIALGTGAAWIYSLVGTLLPSAFPQALRTADGAVPIYFEAAAVITVLVLLGQVLELRAREKTSGAIRALLDLAPKTALRVRAPTARTNRSKSITSKSAKTCACVPVKRCQWMASSSRAREPSTSRWSPASQCPLPRRPVRRSPPAR